MDILKNKAAVGILRDAADRLRSIGVCWDVQTGFSNHGSSIALIVSETEEGVAAGYAASFLGNELANSEPQRFAEEVKDHLANRAVEIAARPAVVERKTAPRN